MIPYDFPHHSMVTLWSPQKQAMILAPFPIHHEPEPIRMGQTTTHSPFALREQRK